ncbi:MAG: S8 family serine peptidase, partial [Acidimicrobiales bacterium]
MRRTRRVVAVLLVAAHALVLPGGRAWGATDPLRSQQWALAQIGAPDAWATATGRGVTIGVIDTGADLNHEDLAGRIVGSTSCIGSGGDPDRCTGDGQDDFGHGTH